jgi:hypothetical protein
MAGFGHALLWGGEGWGDGRRADEVGAACESDPTSMLVEMYWLSLPVDQG